MSSRFCTGVLRIGIVRPIGVSHARSSTTLWKMLECKESSTARRPSLENNRRPSLENNSEADVWRIPWMITPWPLFVPISCKPAISLPPDDERPELPFRIRWVTEVAYRIIRGQGEASRDCAPPGLSRRCCGASRWCESVCARSFQHIDAMTIPAFVRPHPHIVVDLTVLNEAASCFIDPDCVRAGTSRHEY